MGLLERWSQTVVRFTKTAFMVAVAGSLSTYYLCSIAYCFYLLSPQGTACSKMPVSSLPLGSGLRLGYRLEAKEIIYTNIMGAQATSRKIDPLARVKSLYEFLCTFNVGFPCTEQVRIELYMYSSSCCCKLSRKR